MVFDIYTLVEVIWLILPAFAANGMAPLVGKLKSRHPIDGGRKLGKNRLFGNGKTWEGFVFGCIMGAVVGLIEMLAFPYLPWSVSPIPLNLVVMGPLLGFVLGFGAMCGDLVGSFIKRRFDMPRGKSAPLMDQEDFLIGALVLSLLIIPIQLGWFILLVIITPILHWVANLIAYLVKVKKEPW